MGRGLLLLAVVLVALPGWGLCHEDGRVNFPSDLGQPPPPQVRLQHFSGLGGGFTLTGHSRSPVSLGDLAGSPALLFFGYTHCPDICPAIATTLKRGLERLGPKGKGVRVVMVTTDPARDTPERLKKFLSPFGAAFLGLTGAPETLAGMEKRYGAGHWKMNEAGKEGQVAHTSRIYLLDREGRVRFLFMPNSPAADIAKGVRLVLDEGSWFSRVTGWLRS